jgi:holin-like protein
MQILLLCGFSLAGNSIVQVLHIPIPGSILGFFMLLLFLETKVVQPRWLDSGANFLIAELLLFFIPSAVGVVEYKHLIEIEGVSFELIILFSTLTVMAFTGLTAEFIVKHKRRLLYARKH